MELSVKERRAIWAAVKAARDSKMDEERGAGAPTRWTEMDQYFNGWHDAFIEVERALLTGGTEDDGHVTLEAEL